MITNRPPIGLDDVAVKNGDPTSTDSRALQHFSGIHRETTIRTLREAESPEYYSRPGGDEASKPNPRHVLFLAVGEETPSSYMTGLNRAALQLNISLHFHHATRSESNDLLSPHNLPLCLCEELISGIILVNRWPVKLVEKINQRFPVVSIIHTYEETPLDVLGIDHIGGMFSLARHLKLSGFKQIGFLGVDPSVSWSRSRFAGYLEALLALDIPFSENHLVQLDLGALNQETGRMADRVIAAMEKGVHSWICADDFIGYNLCAELRDRGIRIPDDIAIAGFHRNPHIQHGNLPLLTSTEVDSDLIAFNALHQLVYRINYPNGCPQLILMPASFFQGKTTMTLQS
jgi:LacI family transcriptional regulator